MAAPDTLRKLRKTLAIFKRIRYDGFRTCNWRNEWENHGEHVYIEPAAWALLFEVPRLFYLTEK